MKSPTQAGSGIHSDCAQEVLDSAKNWKDKGLSQFESPREFGELVAIPLPDLRATIVDLNAGSGQLLFAAKNGTTKHLLGSDIDPRQSVKLVTDHVPITRLTGDVTKLFALFHEVSWQADLFVLNPPWGLHWKRDRLQELAESPLYTVQSAFLGHDPLCGRDAIDSTAATLMMALHLMSARGEGVMIANQATLERLIFNADAPHRQLKSHIWANAVIKSNPMTKDKGDSWNEEFRTGVIYFAKAHSSGCRVTEEVPDLATFKLTVENLKRDRSNLRRGYGIYDASDTNDDTVRLWTAVRDEWAIRNGKKDHGGYNIFLRPDGTIGTYLSLFERTSFKVNKAEVEKLNALNGQVPMQLVVQAQPRAALLKAVHGNVWRVHPDLPAQVDAAVRAYHSARAPLQKLNPTLALGFLDEEDKIECKLDLVQAGMQFKPYKMPGGDIHQSKPRQSQVLFMAGKSYALRTQAIKVTRIKYKPNLEFGEDEFLCDGRELAIYITDEQGTERCFIEKRHVGCKMDDDVKIDFHLQDIEKHFKIPVPPCVSECDPDGFSANLNAIDRLENLMNEVVS